LQTITAQTSFQQDHAWYTDDAPLLSCFVVHLQQMSTTQQFTDVQPQLDHITAAAAAAASAAAYLAQQWSEAAVPLHC
jgi:hypothetical protein